MQIVSIIVPDLHHVDADPDLSVYFEADPDPTFHIDVDPDLCFHFDAVPDLTFYFEADPDETFHFDADPDPVPRQSWRKYAISGLQTLNGSILSLHAAIVSFCGLHFLYFKPPKSAYDMKMFSNFSDVDKMGIWI